MKALNIGKLTFSSIELNEGLKAALHMESIEIINCITESGLKGRGGAGFPTGLKWKFVYESDDDEKYIVCNADEGEPGTFKDRVILDEYTDLMFEGMTIAGLATGAKKGIVYLRDEYAYLRAHLENVLERRLRDNLVGRNILGKEGFDFSVIIQMGAGAYICGEETALIESLEGHRGEPRNRPPFPVNTGFMGHATTVNNVETLTWVSCILAKGVDWFRSFGTEKSTGRKLFSISGDCLRPGVYEFPMGVTVRELLEEVGGENAKAAQISGAGGHCVPARDFDRTIAYEDLPTGGSIIVFGQGQDMLDVAKNFMEFFVDESCGQCTPCREGNLKLLEGIEMLEQGRCSMQYLHELILLSETMQVASKCGLGQSSPNVFLSVIENFKDEVMGRVDYASDEE